MLTAADLVNREVAACASALISTLAAGVTARESMNAEGTVLGDIAMQAFDLGAPIDDWEEAAIQAGYSVAHGGPYICDPNGEYLSDSEGTIDPTMDDAWRRVCEIDDIEPYQREVFEHWIVSDWLADKLAEHGEKVDKDFAGLTVWARTTTGQAIYADHVIEAITAEVNAA